MEAKPACQLSIKCCEHRSITQRKDSKQREISADVPLLTIGHIVKLESSRQGRSVR